MASGALGLSHQQLNRVLESSCAAPSLLNSQPWAFVLADDRIEVLADPHRRLPYGDPDGRQVRLACGAALFNLRLGLARVGVRSRVWLLPGGPGGPLAVVRNGGFTVLTLRRGELERAIAHRHSNTRPYFATQVPLPHQQVLARAAETEQALLRLVSDPGRLAHLRGWTAAAHQEQLLRPGWTAERGRGRTGPVVTMAFPRTLVCSAVGNGGHRAGRPPPTFRCSTTERIKAFIRWSVCCGRRRMTPALRSRRARPSRACCSPRRAWACRHRPCPS